ncbi:antibiotic biosynthesis monooxygenase [Streptomyces netropsis]|uniref:Heme-degrading monooxygenase HmoA n=1 Tax=Streptomyces netropsis TaxID=55404 RepID=A0A7W7PI28_STRNE|nr:antibiotic biosynthesis monooxygenase [Streptomyces netropsis]MBB4890644.1 heme-degrading monooxygenase HmoA [Streptomyces netropsis]GGR49435.1 antibiotic biosynthesis monooxygenase [Streptomyces netropsis]
MTTTPRLELPRIGRPDAGTHLVSEWIVGSAEGSRTAADMALAEWSENKGRGPDGDTDGSLALHIFLNTDGSSLLHYSQWTSDEAHLAWARNRRDGMIGKLDEVVPGIERPGLHRTRVYRSITADTTLTPGLIVLATVDADTPERQRSWADTVVAAQQETPLPGLVSAHFHLTKDGTRVLKYSEWSDVAAHEAALPVLAASPAWGKVLEHAGTRHLGFKRYEIHGSVTRDGAGR